MRPPEHPHLTLEAEDRAVDVRLAEEHAGVVDQVAGGKVVGAVHHHVVGLEELQGVVRGEAGLVGHHVDVGVDLGQALAGCRELRPAHVRGAVEHLAMEVRLVDHVEVHEPQGADPGGRQVEGERRAQAAGSHHQDARGLEPALPLRPHLGEDQVAAVAAALGRLDLGEVPSGQQIAELATGPAAAPVRRATGDRRHDDQRLARRHGGGVALEVADVRVAPEDVDEGAERAVLGEEMRTDLRVAAYQVGEGLAHRRALDRHLRALAGEAAERGRDLDRHAHGAAPARRRGGSAVSQPSPVARNVSSRKPLRSARSRQLRAAPATPATTGTMR